MTEPQLVEVPSHQISKEHCECEGNQVEHSHCNGQDAQDKVLAAKVGQGGLIQPNCFTLCSGCILNYNIPHWCDDSIHKRGVCEYHDGGQYWYSSPGYEASLSEHPVATLVSDNDDDYEQGEEVEGEDKLEKSLRKLVHAIIETHSCT